MTPLGFLFHHAFLQRKTSHGERKNQVSLTPRSGETVLVFRTDDKKDRWFDEQFGEHFGVPRNDPRSDCVIFYMRQLEDRPIMHRVLFVELKGVDHVHAVEQIDRVVDAVKAKFGAIFGKTFMARENLRAVVVSGRGPPSQFHAKQEEFRRKHGFAVVHCHSDEGEIRKHLA